MSDFVRLLATWALLHESADEGWKAAIERGRTLEAGKLDGGPEAFVDGLAALVAEEKEQLKASLGGTSSEAAATAGLGEALESLRFEIAELRGRVESLQASIDALTRRKA